MGNFFGTYRRTLDAKGRLQVPSKLLLPGLKGLYLLRGFEGCLSVYEEEAFQGLVEKLKGMNFMDPDARQFIRMASASVQELKLDSHGRITLGKDTLMDHGIKEEVVIIGVIDHFEIWDPMSYAHWQMEHSLQYESLAMKSC